MRLLLQILFLSLVTLTFTFCGDTGTEAEEPIPHDFTTAPSEELNQIIENTPSDFTWDFFNENIEIILHDDPQWTGEIVLSGFQVQNAEVENRMTTEPVETNAGELGEGLSTAEMFSGENWFPGEMWISTEEWISSTTWFPGEMWVPSEMEDIAISENDLTEGQTMVVVYAHVPTESVEREQVTRPFGIVFQQRQPSAGTLEAITTTSGSSDDSGYTLFVDGENDTQIGVDDTVFVSGLSEGNHQTELSELNSDCSVSGENPRNVDIMAGDTTKTTFEVNCESGLKNKIAFATYRHDSPEIYVMDSDGSNQDRVTDNADFDGFPIISNDGSKIAFASNRDGGQHLFTMNADGSDVQQITTASTDPGFYSWSPDDSEIVLTDFGDNSLQIYKVNADGSGRTQLTNSSSRDALPTWSPNGDKIAFASERDGDEYQIYTMDTDGGNIEQLTDAALDSYSPNPRWSPDGSKLLILKDGGAIYTIDSDGSNEQQVTDTSNYDGYPAWSADGTEIVFVRDDNIYKINVDGSGSASQLTDSPEIDLAPFWSPAE